MFGRTRALGLGLGLALTACGSDDPPPAMETDASSSGSTGDGTDTNAPTTTPDDATATGSSSGNDGTTTAADSSTSEAESSTGCPAASEGCPCEAGFCDEGLVCSDEGVCEPPPACRSIEAEVHDDEATAITLNQLNCDNTLDVGVIGTLEGPQTDWYRFFGDEGAFCTEQPSATITADVTTEVCVYIECLEGNATGISCGGGSSGADSPEGRPGCCGEDEAVITDYECGGFITPKNVDTWISVGTVEAVCADYGVEYGF